MSIVVVVVTIINQIRKGIVKYVWELTCKLPDGILDSGKTSSSLSVLETGTAVFFPPVLLFVDVFLGLPLPLGFVSTATGCAGWDSVAIAVVDGINSKYDIIIIVSYSHSYSSPFPVYYLSTHTLSCVWWRR